MRPVQRLLHAPKKTQLLDLLRILVYGLVVSTACVAILWKMLPHPIHAGETTVFAIPDYLGEVLYYLSHGRGLLIVDSAITGPGHALNYYAARMPLPILFLALTSKIVGIGFVNVLLVKTALCLACYIVSYAIIQRGAQKLVPKSAWAVLVVICVISLIPTSLANLFLLGAEEGYSTPLLALASALAFYPETWKDSENPYLFLWSAFLGIVVSALFLCKSSMSLACVLFIIVFSYQSKRIAPGIVAASILLLAIAGWLGYTAVSSGRPTLGTSFDAYNLLKGNNPSILRNYPPPGGADLDPAYATMWWGHDFKTEWELSDWSKHQAIAYMRGHPIDTARVDFKKAKVLLLDVTKTGPKDREEKVIEYGRTVSYILARVVLWSSICIAISQIPKKIYRRYSLSYLAILCGICLPYIVGFALTRHATVLVFPAGVMLSRQLILLRKNDPRSAQA